MGLTLQSWHVTEVINVLETGGWVQDRYHSPEGNCLLGAERIAFYGTFESYADITGITGDLHELVCGARSPLAAAEWNDTPGRTSEGVLRRLRYARELLKQKENVGAGA